MTAHTFGGAVRQAEINLSSSAKWHLDESADTLKVWQAVVDELAEEVEKRIAHIQICFEERVESNGIRSVYVVLNWTTNLGEALDEFVAALPSDAGIQFLPYSKAHRVYRAVSVYSQPKVPGGLSLLMVVGFDIREYAPIAHIAARLTRPKGKQ